jgi:ureidoglycolate dehydrogenase (NAD+)
LFFEELKLGGIFYMSQGKNCQSIFPDNLYDFCVTAMLKIGMNEEDAKTTANVLVTTDTWGVYTHGTKQLLNYIKKIKAGGIDPKAVPEIEAEGPGWAIINGHAAMGMVSSCYGMKTAIRKAKNTGIGFAGVKNSTHFGAAGFYANMAAKEDMIGIVMSNVDPCMTVSGAKGPVIGNNPFAYAAPAGNEFPVFMDIALSAVAGQKIYAAHALQKQIPDNWLVDENGLSTNDPSLFPSKSSLVPMAGHKGYGLALMIEILAAVLSGAAITNEVNSWIFNLPAFTNEGHAFISIDVGAIIPIQEFKNRMDQMIVRIKNSPKAKGVEQIYLPGEIEWEKRNNVMKDGMPLPDEVIVNLQNLADELNLDINCLFNNKNN